MELIEIAREAIRLKLEGENFEPNEKTKKKFEETRACFVTLTIDGNLRGCVGSLEARQELWRDVIENAINAAFYDGRFYPLTQDEFKMTKIEVSVLTRPEKVEYNDEFDLKKKISGKGVIIKVGRNSATYLPQVWEQIENADEFLSSLCVKAGLSSEIWKNKKAEVWFYEVEKFQER